MFVNERFAFSFAFERFKFTRRTFGPLSTRTTANRLLHTNSASNIRFKEIPCESSTSIAPMVSNPSSSNTIPEFVSDRIKHLKIDIVDFLVERLATFSSSDESSTKNLLEMAKYYFNQNGKLIRPTICLLIASACNDSLRKDDIVAKQIDLNQYRVAMVSEMIHTASLFHDDVIDQSDTRRGHPTANARWGNRQAVLAGDFILAQATKVLCMIGKPNVISTMAEIVEDLVKGELMQLASMDNLSPSQRFKHYMERNFYKTGSLFSNSCKSVAIISGCNEAVQSSAAEFGHNFGLAFQIVDDVLDYESSPLLLGKPVSNDLKQGLVTCPILFAAEQYPELNDLIKRQFSEPDDAARAYESVLKSDALKKSRELASQYSDEARKSALNLPESIVRDCLLDSISSIINRRS